MQKRFFSLLVLALCTLNSDVHAQGYLGQFSGTAAGRIGNTILPEGTRMNGFWVFHTNVDFQNYYFYQSTSPVFQITIEGFGAFNLTPYEIFVSNNSEAMGSGGLADSYLLTSYQIDPTEPAGLYGSFALSSSDLNVFSDSSLPLSLPPASVFDLHNTWDLGNGAPEDANHWAVGGQIDSVSISQIPEPTTGTLLAGTGIVFFLCRRMRRKQAQT